MSAALEEEVREALGGVIDPELGIDIVNLGLVYGIGIEESDVDIVMTLTVPGCPMHATITRDVESAVRGLSWPREVRVHLVFEPPWSPEKLSPQGRALLGR